MSPNREEIHSKSAPLKQLFGSGISSLLLGALCLTASIAPLSVAADDSVDTSIVSTAAGKKKQRRLGLKNIRLYVEDNLKLYSRESFDAIGGGGSEEFLSGRVKIKVCDTPEFIARFVGRGVRTIKVKKGKKKKAKCSTVKFKNVSKTEASLVQFYLQQDDIIDQYSGIPTFCMYPLKEQCVTGSYTYIAPDVANLECTLHETCCGDGIDNDNDGAIDCKDTSCIGVEGCEGQAPPITQGFSAQFYFFEPSFGVDAGVLVMYSTIEQSLRKAYSKVCFRNRETNTTVSAKFSTDPCSGRGGSCPELLSEGSSSIDFTSVRYSSVPDSMKIRESIDQLKERFGSSVTAGLYNEGDDCPL